ncbi:fimbrillin family protein [Phocaeicola sp.]
MKIKRTYPRILAILLMASTLAACSQDDSLMPDGPADGAIRIHTSVGPFADPHPDAGTRATIDDADGTGAFDDGDEISIYVRTDGEGVLSQSTATRHAGGWNYPLTWSELGGEPTRDRWIDFYAFFPPQTMDADGQFTFSVAADQSTDEAYRASDLLRASAVLSARGDVNLRFSHCMAQIKIVLQKGAGTTDEELNAATVGIPNLYPQTRLGYNGRRVEGSPFENPATITPKKSATEPNTFYALVPYQYVNEKLKLTLHIGGRSIDHEVQWPEPYLYEGWQFTINLTISYAAPRSAGAPATRSAPPAAAPAAAPEVVITSRAATVNRTINH